MKSSLVGSIALVAIVLHSQPAQACSCHDGGPVCEAFWQTPVIFVGRVQSIEKLTPGTAGGPHERVRFHVSQPVGGTSASEIELYNYPTTCHHRFSVRENWLIYASPRGDGAGLTTSTCSRTRLLTEAQEDLEYFRIAYAPAPPKGRIFGRITYPRRVGDTRKLEPVHGAQVKLGTESANIGVTASNRNGEYELFAPAGAHLVTVTLPPGMSVSSSSHIVSLLNTRGCAVADFWASYPGRIRGRALNAVGAPVPNLTIELLSAGARDSAFGRLRAVTNALGRYEITGVEPGAYIPAASVAYGDFEPKRAGIESRYVYSGRGNSKVSPAPIQVEGGSEVDAGTLSLPGSIGLTQVTGSVEYADGRPASGVIVRMKADFDSYDLPWTTIKADAKGRFAFALFEGTRYRLVAETSGPSAVAGRKSVTVTVMPSPNMQQVRLVMR